MRGEQGDNTLVGTGSMETVPFEELLKVVKRCGIHTTSMPVAHPRRYQVLLCRQGSPNLTTTEGG